MMIPTSAGIPNCSRYIVQPFQSLKKELMELISLS